MISKEPLDKRRAQAIILQVTTSIRQLTTLALSIFTEPLPYRRSGSGTPVANHCHGYRARGVVHLTMVKHVRELRYCSQASCLTKVNSEGLETRYIFKDAEEEYQHDDDQP